ncbi:MAG: DEAD/DEAH box helicase [Ndongobacter sp.]|nr:DEAD/DEAH box helicase [Ndongobacter sp.]
MNAYEYLSQPVRRYIFEKGWKRLRPIQAAAIKMVRETEDNLVLIAPTASGKTEAAFFPAISEVSDWSAGIRILVISPLIALINDQFRRVEELCEELAIPVTAWHGEANAAAKKRLLREPRGIVLITPESLEAMLDHRPAEARTLFSSLEWIFIDELHSFLGTPRGIQLQSLLQRMRDLEAKNPRCLAMSATIAHKSFPLCRDFFANGRATRILLDRKTPQPQSHLFFQPAEQEEQALSPDLVDAIYRQAVHKNLLIFANTRRSVEELAHALQRRQEETGEDVHFFAHHSSVERQLRLEAEQFAREAGTRFSICCTSTLELGIDIGAVDGVVQVEAPLSASSLAQRLGRSGRGERQERGKWTADPSTLYFYATTDWSFLQGMAALSLVLRGELEEIRPITKPYPMLAHQILAEVLACTSVPVASLLTRLRQRMVWASIEEEELREIVAFLVEEDYLEWLGAEEPEVILGQSAEAVVFRRDFYTMFFSEEEYEVRFDRQRIGSLPLTLSMQTGSCILLSGRMWVIEEIDEKAHRIQVKPASEGQAPTFSGRGASVSRLLRQEMLRLLREGSAGLRGESAADVLARIRRKIPAHTRLQLISDGTGEDALLCFTGTRIEQTLYVLFSAYLAERGRQPGLSWRPSEACIRGVGLYEVLSRVVLWIRDASKAIEQAENLLRSEELLRKRLLSSVKYADLVPMGLQIRYICQNLLDWEGAFEVLSEWETEK